MTEQQRPRFHGSIPGYIPGRPILNRGHKALLWGLLIVPAITYGILKLREQQRDEKEKSLEVEGRAMWDSRYGKKDALNVNVGRSGGGV